MTLLLPYVEQKALSDFLNQVNDPGEDSDLAPHDDLRWRPWEDDTKNFVIRKTSVVRRMRVLTLSRFRHSFVRRTVFPQVLSCNHAVIVHVVVRLRAWMLITASSRHSGGVNVTRGDASMRFISDGIIDGGDSTASGPDGSLQNYSGRSLYGVWGAMGSKNGNETVTVP